MTTILILVIIGGIVLLYFLWTGKANLSGISMDTTSKVEPTLPFQIPDKERFDLVTVPTLAQIESMRGTESWGIRKRL